MVEMKWFDEIFGGIMLPMPRFEEILKSLPVKVQLSFEMEARSYWAFDDNPEMKKFCMATTTGYSRILTDLDYCDHNEVNGFIYRLRSVCGHKIEEERRFLEQNRKETTTA